MSDDRTIRGGRDRDLINTEQKHELNYMQEKLGVSREELLQAIQEVGNDREKVEEYIRNKPNRSAK